YTTKESLFSEDGFSWTLSLKSKNIINPMKLEGELNKNLCEIVNITRQGAAKWTYDIDISDSILNIKRLRRGVKLKLKRSLYAKWVDVSEIKKAYISSSIRNSWHPYISYFDKSLNLLNVLKIDKKSSNLRLEFEDDVYYMKISDLYTLKNLRDDLTLIPTASR
ncbi:MAG: hypothetical protein GXO30_04540, partial [Epsilonproteobacteria bacterium]|nr:hypothetical protein [Campylobacterota bacterium]